MTYLHKAILIISIFGLPLQACSNTNKNMTNSDSTQNPSSDLIKAIILKNSSLVAQLLSKKPDLEIKNKNGRTALMIASYTEDNKIAEMLIKAGSNVNAQDDMLNSPFLYAGASGYIPLLKMCLANGADFKIFNRYGGSALIPAAEKGHLEVVKILTSVKGYPINHVNRLGWTALLEAILLSEKGDTQTAIVSTLVNAGADVNIPDRDGITSLQHAKSRSLEKVVEILLNAKAK